MQFLRRAWTKYNGLLQGGGWQSVATKCVTSAGIVGAGDVACQIFIEKRNFSGFVSSDHRQLDLQRFCRFAFLGGAFIAPCLHIWYGFLGRSIQGSGFAPALKRMALDQ